MNNIKDLIKNYIPYVRHMQYESMSATGVTGYLIDWDDDFHWLDDWVSMNWYFLVSRLYSCAPDFLINFYKYGYPDDMEGYIGKATHRVVVLYQGVKHNLDDFVFKPEDNFQQCYLSISCNVNLIEQKGDYKTIPFEELDFIVEPAGKFY
ncbi:MAG TPA: hypothetical protein PLH48_16695 [Acinetobacter johnsonii]|nr:hypothetical protein [Acinetobacter johnsonii]